MLVMLVVQSDLKSTFAQRVKDAPVQMVQSVDT